MHKGGGDRDQFLSEALMLAKQGVVKREKNALVVNDLEQLEKIVNEVRDF